MYTTRLRDRADLYKLADHADAEQSKFDSLGRRNIQLSGITMRRQGAEERGRKRIEVTVRPMVDIDLFAGSIPGHVAQNRYAVRPPREIHYSDCPASPLPCPPGSL